MNWIWENPYLPFGDARESMFRAYEAGASAMLAAVLIYLDEPCGEHGGYQVKDGIKTIHSIPHRKDCPQCLNELKEANK
jgi:hypothetical protein